MLGVVAPRDLHVTSPSPASSSAVPRLRDHRTHTFDSTLFGSIQDWIGGLYAAAGFTPRRGPAQVPTYAFEERASGRPACGLVGRRGPADVAWLPLRDLHAQAEGLLGLFTDLAGGLGLEVARVEVSGAPELAPFADTTAPGEFPRLDLHSRDALGRAWSLGRIETVDTAIPSAQSPLANATHLRASLLGPLPDILALLFEHGPLPFWLSPEQVRVLVVSERHLPWADVVAERLRVAGLRVESPATHARGTLAGRVRLAQEARVPRILVVGAREASNHTVALRGEANSLDLDVCAQRFEREARAPGTSPNQQWVVSCAARLATYHTR